MRELEWDPKVSAAHVGVRAKDGAIVLTGHVSSYAERLGAIAAAERVYGVRAVADEIEVKLPGKSGGDDEISPRRSCGSCARTRSFPTRSSRRSTMAT